MSQNDYPSVIFRINHDVDFDPLRNTLTQLTTGQICTLFSAASRCLELLLERHRQVVSQKELISYGWGEYDSHITPNAFYQHIANIRRAFEELLPDQNIVVTVKRVGMVIPEEVDITRIPVTPLIEVSEEASTPLAMADSVSQETKKWTLASKILAGSVFLSILVLGVSAEMYHQVTEDNNDFYNDYIFYKTSAAKCDIFINKAGNRQPNEKLLATIDAKGCDEYNQVYLTSWTDWPRHSVLYCTKPTLISRERNCVTLFYGDHFL